MNRVPSAAAAAVMALTLTGCISLLPKSQPADLFRFGVAASAADTQAAAKTVQVLKGSTEFEQAAAGDRILTVTGDSTAYVAGVRWVSPASVLFDEALDRAFENSPTAPRLDDPGRSLGARTLLRLKVENFETRYDNGPDAAPVVVVHLQATLIGTKDRAVLAERLIDVRQPASENRVASIVQAYDAAVTQALSQLTTWTTQITGGAAV